MSDPKEKTLLPPYIGYKTFINFINSLKSSGVPMQIDRSVLRNMSGSAQSAIVAALRFLRLIDPNSRPTAALKQLVDADENEYKKLLHDVICNSYSFLTNDGIHLEKATGKQVEDKFREQGVSGSTVYKAMSFFLAAAEDIGLKVSVHVRPPAVPKSQNTKKPAKKKSGSSREEEDINPQNPPPPTQTWQEQLLAKFPAFDPSWDADTQKKWFTAFEELMKKG